MIFFNKMNRTENNCFQLFDKALDEMKCFLLFFGLSLAKMTMREY